MRQPPGFEEEAHLDQVCLLQKSLYGLKRAARTWNQTVHNALVGGKFLQSQADPCMYCKIVKNHSVYVLVYVDDIVVASDVMVLIDETSVLLKNNFEMKCLGPIRNYLGLEIEQDANSDFFVSQTDYIKTIVSEIGLSDAKLSEYPLDPNYGKTATEGEPLLDNRLYQKYIGCILYISINTYPDISASVSILARRVSKPSQEDWTELKRAIRYLKGTANLKLKLSSVDDDCDILVGFADADWAENRDDRKSNSGFIFKVYGGAISWCYRHVFLYHLLKWNLFHWRKHAYMDHPTSQRSQRGISNTNNNLRRQPKLFKIGCLKLVEKYSNRTKHIDTKYNFIKQLVETGTIVCKYLPSENRSSNKTIERNGNRIKYLRKSCGLIGNECLFVNNYENTTTIYQLSFIRLNCSLLISLFTHL